MLGQETDSTVIAEGAKGNTTFYRKRLMAQLSRTEPSIVERPIMEFLWKEPAAAPSIVERPIMELLWREPAAAPSIVQNSCR